MAGIAYETRCLTWHKRAESEGDSLLERAVLTGTQLAYVLATVAMGNQEKGLAERLVSYVQGFSCHSADS